MVVVKKQCLGTTLTPSTKRVDAPQYTTCDCSAPQGKHQAPSKLLRNFPSIVQTQNPSLGSGFKTKEFYFTPLAKHNTVLGDILTIPDISFFFKMYLKQNLEVQAGNQTNKSCFLLYHKNHSQMSESL